MWLVLLISIRGRSGQCTWLPEYILEICTCLYCLPLICVSWACYEMVYNSCVNVSAFSRVITFQPADFCQGNTQIPVSLIKDYSKGSTSLNGTMKKMEPFLFNFYLTLMFVSVKMAKYWPPNCSQCWVICVSACLQMFTGSWWSDGTLQGTYCSPCMTVCVSSWMLTSFTLF